MGKLLQILEVQKHHRDMHRIYRFCVFLAFTLEILHNKSLKIRILVAQIPVLWEHCHSNPGAVEALSLKSRCSGSTDTQIPGAVEALTFEYLFFEAVPQIQTVQD